jgi:hypothetical protein
MTPEELKGTIEKACVNVAASHDCMWTGNRLDPRLWEALRIELQRRYRRSTGETMAVLTIDNSPTAPAPNVEGDGQ